MISFFQLIYDVGTSFLPLNIPRGEGFLGNFVRHEMPPINRPSTNLQIMIFYNSIDEIQEMRVYRECARLLFRNEASILNNFA